MNKRTDKMINFLSLFSGIGAFEKALDRLGIQYNLVNYCEIDKYASKSYSAVHEVPESLNLGDITKVDTSKLPRIDMISYGFPCQDISLAGKQKGLFNDDGTQTRSGLFFEALRIIEDTKPKVAIAENVKNLVSKKFNAQFQIVLESLEQAGYNNYWQVLNAKDYGVPQNRERVFIVSIRKDVDTGNFKFPEGFPLKLRLKDLLEPEVDERFYLKGLKDFFIKNSFDMEAKGNGFRFSPHVKQNSNCAKTITTNAGSRMDDNFILDGVDSDEEFFRFDTTNKLLIKENTKRGRVGKQVAQTLTTLPQQGVVINPLKGISPYGWHFEQQVYDAEGITRTVKAGGGSGNMPKVIEDLKIRKLTPLECWRLMGFADEDFYKAEKVNSNTQLYKQAGNSIVVDVLEYLFKEIMEVLEVKKVEDKVVVYECDSLINLEALKEKEPELYEELLADYPCETATYVFKVVS